MKKIITSWGNTSVKNVTISNEIIPITLSIGNNNSYGDASIPLSNNCFKDTYSEGEDIYLNPSMTLKNFIDTKKFFPFGIPGKNNVTLGGAAASDVHGKDSGWGGSFINNISSLRIKLPSEEIIETSEQKNQEVFFSTIGGYGLTGSIVGLGLKKNKNQFSSTFETTIKKGLGVGNLVNHFSNKKGEYSVAWLDLLNKDEKWVLEVAKPVLTIENRKTDKKPISLEPRFAIPFIGNNKFKSMSYINQLYYKINIDKSQKMKHWGEVFYPLSYLSDTRNVSKKRKIIQVQFSIPEKNVNYLTELLSRLAYQQKPLLCSIKKLGTNHTNLNLSFVQKGWTCAVDFSEDSFNYTQIREFYKRLIDLEGKVYLAKDCTLEENEFKEMYTNHTTWSKLVKNIDPENIFQSQMSKRLGLKNW